MARLLDRAIREQDDHLLDLGCGQGAWLLRALKAHDGVTAVGVDISGKGFDPVLSEAARLGLADRLELHRQDVAEYRSTRKADLVLSVGAAHAFGGLLPTLNAAREHLAEDGMLLLGDCFWEREPDAAVRAELEDGPQTYADLPTTVAQIVADGWTPVYGHISTLAKWALDNPEHPDHDLALQTSATHRTSWLGGYRGILGFVVLLLRRTPPPASTEVS